MAVEKRVLLPDIGDFHDVDVVEVVASAGSQVAADDPLIVLETDKATLEIPAPFPGVVKQITVSVGDTVNQGELIAVMEVDEAPQEKAVEPPASASERTDERGETKRAEKTETAQKKAPPEPPPARTVPESVIAPSQPLPAAAQEEVQFSAAKAHASPSVRRLSRELGVDLSMVPSSGRKGRVLKEDVQAFVKGMLAKGTAAGVPISGVTVAKAPDIDFSKFGPTQLQPLNKVRKLSSANLHRSWVTVPHVTQHDEADVTDLEAFRVSQRAEAEKKGVKLTFLPLLMRAVVKALEEFPHFNSSLDRTGENLILKQYFHIGVAVDTPQGLVVPVVRDVDQKNILDLAAELMEVSAKARERKLRPEDLQGGTFSISSLGGIGGTFFTPIVNHPEVAILGVSRTQWKPVYQDGELVPRLVLPLSLSYDHRVIDGADAVRFTTRLAQLLGDLRLILL